MKKRLLTEEETAALIVKIQDGDEDAEELLVEHNIRLVWSVVKRFKKDPQEKEDLFQLGSIGLIKAARKFDLSKGYKFNTFAVPCIQSEIRRFLRDNGGIFKVSRPLNETANKIHTQELYEKTPEEIAKALEMDDIELVADALHFAKNHMTRSIEEKVQNTISGAEPSTLGEMIKDENEDWFDTLAIKMLITGLDAREQKVIRLRYLDDLSQYEVADIIGVSQVHISRIEKKAIKKMRELCLEEELK